MKKVAVAVCIGMLLLAGTVCLLLFSSSSTSESGESAERRSGAVADHVARSDGRSHTRSGSSASSPSERREKPVLSVSGLAAKSDGAESDDAEDDEDDDGVKLTPEERQLAKEIEDALDREDIALAIRCAPKAMRSRVRSIRESMVDTLGWFGGKALPELTPFMADADEDIAESAFDEWSKALNDIEDDGEKLATVERAMQVLTDEDQLEDISSEYIGVDEKLSVESLLRIIEGDGSAAGIAKAKETYEFVTGDEFEGRAAAEKWIAEEYEPSEDGQ